MNGAPRLLIAAAIVVGFSAPAHVVAGPQPQRGQETRAERVEFNRDVRPILSDKCFRCHGPDSAAREADLRLDLREAALADRDGTPAIVAGQPSASGLIARIASSDEFERMPPASTGKPLSKDEIETLRRWIEQGAEYQPHWAFIAPVRPVPPEVVEAGWLLHPIDAFVAKRLQEEGLQPSPEAERTTLIRRVTLDLTGLPPSPDEVDAFLADDAPGAYERVVDRLLASPRYGERMALAWLDAARYADTNGYFTDKERSMWRWRDWVIDAYNSNLPFDRFTVEQLAGDLLERPTLEQQIATGFNRNHMVNDETGIVEEEYRVEYVVDRLHTTSTVWMGLTVGCARCHDHKFDPLSQREFYGLFAFFNNVPERGLSGGQGNSAPVIDVPTAAWLARRGALRQKADEARKQLEAAEPQLAAAQAAWEQTALENLPSEPADGLIAHYRLEGNGEDSSGENRHGTPEGSPQFGAGLIGQAVTLDGDSHLVADGELAFDRDTPFSFGLWIHLTDGRPACVLSKNDDNDSLRGFDLLIRKGRAAVHLVHRWNGDAIQVVTKQPVARNRWQHVAVTYDGSSRAAGVAIYLDGRPAEVDVNYDSLTGSIRTTQPLRIGRRSTSAPFVGSLDDVRLYDRRLSSDEVRQLAERQFLQGALGRPHEQRTAEIQSRLRQLYVTEFADAKLRDISRSADEHAHAEREFASTPPTAMVMQEMKEPRETYLLERGEYDRPKGKVEAGIPGVLPPLPPGAPPNRLGLAQWLVHRSHPLTARVAVNRLWQMYFGEGIVKSAEDFGSQGDLPSHPELLDWLAVEFVESGWDVKHLARLIVTSATYRQSSHVSPESALRDRDNRLLARGPRFRMSAETLRDNALAVSGLLVERVGGPSVKPYQPEGLWKAVVYDGDLEYRPDTGADLYRRGLYTYWKRQSPPPALLAFDAPTREMCVIRRSRTNTPLQALVLMNDPTFVEAARALAERTLREADGGTIDERARHAFRLATAREPEPDETAVLVEVFQAQLAEFRQNAGEAQKLLAVGESPADGAFDAVELAAWTAVASVILSLDETVTKE